MPEPTTADDDIVQTTAAVLEGERPDGTQRLHRVGLDDVADDGGTPFTDAGPRRADGAGVAPELERRVLDRP